MPKPTPVPAALALIALFASASLAAPLHPQTVRSLPASELRAIPPEPVVGTATQFGRTWTGHPRVLVLLLDFEDRPADRDAFDPAHFEQLLFSLQEMEFGSLRDWYLDASYGRIDFTGEVHGWLSMPLAYADYANKQSGLCNACSPRNGRGLATHAIQAAVTAGIDLTRFDNDGPDGIPGSGDDDGIIDGLALVVPGFGAERTGKLTDLRSHYWDLKLGGPVEGMEIPDYIVFPEQENVGVAVHEFGHLLGAEDLYDQSGRGAGVGNYSVMATAMWFRNAMQPGGPDPFTRTQWGILDPVIPGADEPRVDIPSINDLPFALRLWTRGEMGSEYYLVENRRPVGVDALMHGEGLLVYHVDETVSKQNNPGHYRVRVVQADGLQSLEGKTPRNSGEQGDFFPGTHGVREIDDSTQPGFLSHNGDSTQVALRDISDAAPVMQVAVEVGRSIGSGPAPRLEVIPEGGLFAGAVVPGQPSPVEVRIKNEGTRLGGGDLHLFSRDPRVTIDRSRYRMTGMAALETRSLGQVLVAVDLASTSQIALPLEAVWESPTGSYQMAVPIPLAGNVAQREGFETREPHVWSQSLGEGSDPWTRTLQRAAEGEWSHGTPDGYGPTTNAALYLGPVVLGGTSELRFRHYLNTPSYDGFSPDGGFLEVSTDEGHTWELLLPQGGYPTRFDLSQGNPYPDHPAWGGRSDGWESVVVPLDHLSGRVTFRFHFVSDFSGSSGIFEGWFIDEILVRTWERPHAAFFAPPVVGEDRVEVGFHVLSVVGTDHPGTIRLIRETGSEQKQIDEWSFVGQLDQTASITDGEPGRVDHYYLEWIDGLSDRIGPLVVTNPGQIPRTLLGATPTLIRRSEGATVRYRVPGTQTVFVTVDLFDLQGGHVLRMDEGLRNPGSHRLPFPGRSETGRMLRSGVYFLRLTGPTFGETLRIVLVS